jgi:hypothetical protein
MGSFHASGNLLKCSDQDFDGIAAAPGLDVPLRGVGWLLRWAAAIGVLWFAGCVLAEFTYSLAAERALSRAARAGALEATLPRATYRSVCETVKRRLANRAAWANQMSLTVQQNGIPVGGAIRAIDGDRMSVTLALPLRVIMPRWLSAVSFQASESRIEARAEREVPGRFCRRAY